MNESDGVIRLSQAEEYAPQVVMGEGFSYRLAYARAAETQTADNVGQDYLVVYEDESVFVFVLCDGVSQSFYGDLAARYLGDELLTWLREQPKQEMSSESFQTALEGYLLELTAIGTERVQRETLPTDIPKMLREVLEEKRALGSETMFVCGRLDTPDTVFPEGRLILAWMGDSRARVWREEKEINLPGSFRTEQRWSTRRGPVAGHPHVYITSLQQKGERITRVVVYSDGLTALDTWSPPPANSLMEEMITEAERSANSDDISFLEIWPAGIPEQVEMLPLPATTPFVKAEEDGHIRAAWSPVPQATGYEIQIKPLRQDHPRSFNIPAPNWHPEQRLKPGVYRLRVRALQDQAVGQWSPWQSVEIPELGNTLHKTESTESSTPSSSSGPTRSILNSKKLLLGSLLLILALFGVGLGLTLPPRAPLHPWLFGKPVSSSATPTPTLTLQPAVSAPTSTLSPSPVATPLVMHSPLETPTPTMPNERVFDSPLSTPTTVLTATVTPSLTRPSSPLPTPSITVTNPYTASNFRPTATSVIPAETVSATETLLP
jgi:hypothetical protein